MRTRHRIPSIFNLSMVDVLCCALGCVILLWLLNLRDAKERAQLAERASAELVQARSDLEAWRRTASENQDRFLAASKQAEAAEKERDRVQSRLGDIQARLSELDRDLRELPQQDTPTARRLVRQTPRQR